jgi:hypothetical protein
VPSADARVVRYATIPSTDDDRAGAGRDYLDVTLPRSLRNPLADLILRALYDAEARRALQALAALGPDGRHPLADLPECALRTVLEEREGSLQLQGRFTTYAAELGERSRRAWRVIAPRLLHPPDPPLGVALDEAAALFDAGLYYEVHEWLERYWMRAGGDDREALQGLIQVAVGYEHLARGNARGASELLAAGCRRLWGRRLEGLDLDPFARAVLRWLETFEAPEAPGSPRFDQTCVPSFPAVTDRQPGTAPGGGSP